MSVIQVKLHCTHCGLRRAYQVGDEVPRQCPQCHLDSKPRFAWLRSKVPFLPLLGWIVAFPSLWLYDILVMGTAEHQVPWLPYVMALAVFGLAWMLATLFLNWPKTPLGPHVIPEIRWTKEDANPEEVVGSEIVMRLEEHHPRTRFVAVIEGSKSILSDDEEDSWKNDRVYILMPKLESSAIRKEQRSILFRPEWVEFKRGVRRMLLKKYRQGFSHRPSIEELVLNPDCLFKGIWGKVYRTEKSAIPASEIPSSYLKVPYAIGRLSRRKGRN